MDRLNQKIAESETMIAALQQTHKTMLALRNKLETTWDRGDCLQTDELAALIGSNGKMTEGIKKHRASQRGSPVQS